jgi:endonuclease-3
MDIHEKIRKILVLLNSAYGARPAFKKTDPVDELVRTILSQNTNDRNSLAAFAVLKKNFRSWDKALETPTAKIARLIKHAGLGKIKAARIKGVLGEIERREGRISLRVLAKLGTEEALEYLRSLKGVGPKTAACVLLFSFGKPVMPVDTHIFRVTKRLGLIDDNLGIKEAHEALTELLTEFLTLRRGRLRRPCSGSSTRVLQRDLIYGFHLGIIEHGRKTCISQGPRCGSCVLYRICAFGKKGFYRKKELCR